MNQLLGEEKNLMDMLEGLYPVHEKPSFKADLEKTKEEALSLQAKIDAEIKEKIEELNKSNQKKEDEELLSLVRGVMKND